MQCLQVEYYEPRTENAVQNIDRFCFPAEESLVPAVVRCLVSAKLKIDPYCVACTSLAQDSDGNGSAKVLLKKRASTAVCPPFTPILDVGTGQLKSEFTKMCHCFGCEASMSDAEFTTECLPMMCGHTLCKTCAEGIIAPHRGKTTALLVCKYCHRSTLASPRWSREAINGEGLENLFSFVKVEQSCSNHPHGDPRRFCKSHDALVCSICAQPDCQLVDCDDPEAQRRLRSLAYQKAFELGRHHDLFIKFYSWMEKHKAALGPAHETLVCILADGLIPEHCARVLQLRRDVLRLKLSLRPTETPEQALKAPLKKRFPLLFLDACREYRAKGPALSFKTMRRLLQYGNLKYLDGLTTVGFFATATSATDALGRNLWHCVLPRLSLELLKEWGADFSTVATDRRTAAHFAARQGDAARLGVVCSLGTKPKSRDSRGLAAAHYAAINDHAPCLEVLPATCLEKQDAHGWTPAHHAASNGSVRVIAFLLRRGISIHGVATPQGDLPVHLATRHGHINVLKLFYGVNSLSNENDGTTAIHIAAGGRLDCLTWLHEHGCQLDAPMGNGTQRTALHIAAQRVEPVFVKILKYLLRHANDARDTRTDDGKTAAHFAADSGNVAGLAALREAGASMTLTDARGWKPIHYAAQKGWLVCLEVLRNLQHSCADVEEALRIATAQNLLKCVEWLRSWVEALRHAASLTHRAPTLPLPVGRRSDTSSSASTSSSVRTHAFHLPTPRQAPTYNLAAGWVGSGDPVMDDFLQQLAVQEALRAAAL